MAGPAFIVSKNSGILRFIFGASTQGRNAVSAAIVNASQVIQVLGAGADAITPDQDGQWFSPSPGHGIVPGFDGAAALAEQPSELLQAGLPHSRGYIPGSTKVHAYFLPTDPLSVGQIAVRTQVVNSQIRAGTNGTGNNVIVDANGLSFLAAIRVSVKAFGAGALSVAGILVVELQHSEHDIQGLPAQDQDATAPIIP